MGATAPNLSFSPHAATAPQAAAPASAPPHSDKTNHAETPAEAQEQTGALVPVSAPAEGDESTSLTFPEGRLPIELDVSIPLRDFRVRSLLGLHPGALVESEWAHGSDLPLSAGKVILAWSEFEVVDSQLAIRVTRLG